MKKSCLKVGIYYDWINQWGGAEQVLLDILKIFPNADILTLFHRPQSWLPQNTKIITPPFFTKKYDFIISTSSYLGYLIPANIYYFHNVNRYVYNSPLKYFDRFIIPKNKIYLCNSNNVKKRIKKHFNIDASIVYPGIDTDFFTPTKNPILNYYLIVGRFVEYKKIDSAIIACQNLKQKLIVVGTGRQEKYLKKIADPNYINFVGKISKEKLKKLYQNCKALLCPQIEDFGLTALESQSCGRPVIALAKGGNLETVSPSTGILFSKNLSKAISNFSINKFNPIICRQNALKFSKNNFMLNFKKYVRQ